MLLYKTLIIVSKLKIVKYQASTYTALHKHQILYQASRKKINILHNYFIPIHLHCISLIDSKFVFCISIILNFSLFYLQKWPLTYILYIQYDHWHLRLIFHLPLGQYIYFCSVSQRLAPKYRPMISRLTN